MITGFPFERVGIDVIGPLPFTPADDRYILVMVDYFTKWAEAVPLRRQDAASVTNALLSEWIAGSEPHFPYTPTTELTSKETCHSCLDEELEKMNIYQEKETFNARPGEEEEEDEEEEEEEEEERVR
nr:unnamed protein product [Spirometra erinaceieuropaei]